MDASDWDPLLPEQLGLCPGEDVDLGKVGKGPNSVPERVHSEPREPNGRDICVAAQQAEAELAAKQTRALALLQKKVAAAPKVQSLVGELEDREHKRKRRRRAAQASALTELAPVKCAVLATDIPLEVAYSPQAGGRDPREDEEWFRGLPSKEQQRLRRRWAFDRQRVQHSGRWNARKTGRAVLNGIVVAGVIGLLLMFLGSSLVSAAALALYGGLGAGTAQLCGGGRFGYAAAGVLAYFVVFGAALIFSPYAMIGAMLMGFGFAAIGMEHEMRRSGGFGND